MGQTGYPAVVKNKPGVSTPDNFQSTDVFLCGCQMTLVYSTTGLKRVFNAALWFPEDIDGCFSGGKRELNLPLMQPSSCVPGRSTSHCLLPQECGHGCGRGL